MHTGQITVNIGAHAALALLLSCDRVTRRELVVAGIFCFFFGCFVSSFPFSGSALAALRFEPGGGIPLMSVVACFDGASSLVFGLCLIASGPFMAHRLYGQRFFAGPRFGAFLEATHIHYHKLHRLSHGIEVLCSKLRDTAGCTTLFPHECPRSLCLPLLGAPCPLL